MQPMFDFLPADVMPRPPKTDSRIPPLQQSAEFAAALRLAGQTPLVLDRLKNTLVLHRRLRGIPVAMVNRAHIAKPLRLLEMLQEEGLHRTPVILSPDNQVPDLARHGAVPLMSPARTAQWDLNIDQDARRAGLHQKWRNRLNHAERQGLRVTRQNMPGDANHWLLTADVLQQQAKGYKSWPAALTLAYAQANTGQAKLFQAFDGNEPVAAMLILRHGRGATYHISHATVRGKQLSAHNLLLWEAASWLSAKGCEQLELGVINTEDAPGLARFKLGTGARLHSLGGTWGYWPPARRLLRPLAALDRRMMAA
jgi:hypothetical protein